MTAVLPTSRGRKEEPRLCESSPSTLLNEITYEREVLVQPCSV